MILVVIATLLIFASGFMIGFVFAQERAEARSLSHTELDDRLAPYPLKGWSITTGDTVFTSPNVTTGTTGGNVTWRTDDDEME